jgi:hypothetical protein
MFQLIQSVPVFGNVNVGGQLAQNLLEFFDEGEATLFVQGPSPLTATMLVSQFKNASFGGSSAKVIMGVSDVLNSPTGRYAAAQPTSILRWTATSVPSGGVTVLGWYVSTDDINIDAAAYFDEPFTFLAVGDTLVLIPLFAFDQFPTFD